MEAATLPLSRLSASLSRRSCSRAPVPPSQRRLAGVFRPQFARGVAEPTRLRAAATEEAEGESGAFLEEEDIQESRIVLYIKVDAFATSVLTTKVVDALRVVEGVLDVSYNILESIATITVMRESTSLAPLSGASIISVMLAEGFQPISVSVSFDDEVEEDPQYFNFDGVVKAERMGERDRDHSNRS